MFSLMAHSYSGGTVFTSEMWPIWFFIQGGHWAPVTWQNQNFQLFLSCSWQPLKSLLGFYSIPVLLSLQPPPLPPPCVSGLKWLWMSGFDVCIWGSLRSIFLPVHPLSLSNTVVAPDHVVQPAVFCLISWGGFSPCRYHHRVWTPELPTLTFNLNI